MAELTAHSELPSAAPQGATGVELEFQTSDPGVGQPSQGPDPDEGLGSGASDWEPQPPPEIPPEPVIPDPYGPEPSRGAPDSDRARFEDRVAKMGGLEAVQEYQRALNEQARREGREEPYEVSQSVQEAWEQHKADVEALTAEGALTYRQQQRQQLQQAAFDAWFNKLPKELQEAYNKGGSEGFERARVAYNERAAESQTRFERQLAKGPKELWDAYYRGGYPTYERAVREYRPKPETQSSVPDEFRDWSAYELLNGRIENGALVAPPFGVQGTTYVSLPDWAKSRINQGVREAVTAITAYRGKDNRVDVAAAIRGGVSPQTLELAGIPPDSISRAAVIVREEGKSKVPQTTYETWQKYQEEQRQGNLNYLEKLPTGLGEGVAGIYADIEKGFPGTEPPAAISRGMLKGAVDVTTGFLFLPAIAGSMVASMAKGSGGPFSEREKGISVAGQTLSDALVGMWDYLWGLGEQSITAPAEGIPHTIVANLPLLLGALKGAVRIGKGGYAAAHPAGVPNRSIAIELDVARVPWEESGYASTLRTVGQALDDQIRADPGTKGYVREARVRFPDRALELAAILNKDKEFAKLKTEPVRALNLADAQNIPERLAGPLKDWLRDSGARLSGSFSEWLHVPEAVRPKDMDIVVKNVSKAQKQLVSLAGANGYEARVNGTAIEIRVNGEWVELADVVSTSRNKAMMPKGLKVQSPSVVDGVNVSPIGEQFIRLTRILLSEEADVKGLRQVKHYPRLLATAEYLFDQMGMDSSQLHGELSVKYRVTPMQKIAPDTVYHATPNAKALLDSLRENGQVTIKGKLFTSPQGAFDFMRQAAKGEPASSPGVIAIRLGKDWADKLDLPYKQYKGAIEAEVVSKGGVKLYATDLNRYGKSHNGLTAETFTQYKGSTQRGAGKGTGIAEGQFVPVYWLNLEGVKGSAPSVSALYAATVMALVETVKDVPYVLKDIPNLLKRRPSFQLFGAEDRWLHSTRRAYDEMKVIATKLEREVDTSRKGKVKSPAEDDLRVVEQGRKEIADLLEDSAVKRALRSDEAKNTFRVSLAKYLQILKAGDSGVLPQEDQKPLTEERPAAVDYYRYEDGRLVPETTTARFEVGVSPRETVEVVGGERSEREIDSRRSKSELPAERATGMVREPPRETPREPSEEPPRETPRGPEEPPREPPTETPLEPPRVPGEPPREPPPEPPAPPRRPTGGRLRRSGSGSSKQTQLPEGSITWLQGFTWKWVPHEDWSTGAAKPRSLPRGITPVGAVRTDLRTPQETVQVIGGGTVPDVDVDLGVADVSVRGSGSQITFKGRGLGTDIGVGVPGPAQGMTVGGQERQEPEPESVIRPVAAEKMVEAQPAADGVEYTRKHEVGARKNKRTPEYLDEDEEWLDSLDPPIVSGRYKSKTRRSRRSLTRGEGTPTAVRGIKG